MAPRPKVPTPLERDTLLICPRPSPKAWRRRPSVSCKRTCLPITPPPYGHLWRGYLREIPPEGGYCQVVQTHPRFAC